MKTGFLCLFLFFVSCSSKETVEKEVFARVGNETLTKEKLLFLAGNQAGDADVFSRIINNWVENKLLYSAALSAGLDKDLALIKQKDLFYEKLLVSAFIKIQTKKKSKTTKKEVSDYYLKNKESFRRTDDEVVVKHFTFSSAKAAKETMKELKKKKTKIDLEGHLKRQKVETKTIKKDGAGSNLVSYVFAGDIGDVLGPKKHNNSFHVFQILQKHKKGSFLGLEKVYDEIYQRLYKEKEISVVAAVVDSLYLNSDVFVSQGALKK